MTQDQIIKAGQMMKVVRLAKLPGMDSVAVKLNCGLTYDEELYAKKWAKAFDLATSNKPLFELATELYSS